MLKIIGKSLDEKGVTEFCKERMAGYKRPRSMEFVTELPRNPSGKIMKKELRANDKMDRKGLLRRSKQGIPEQGLKEGVAHERRASQHLLKNFLPMHQFCRCVARYRGNFRVRFFTFHVPDSKHKNL